MTEAKEGMRKLLKEQGLTDEDIEKKLCVHKSGNSILFGKKKSKK